MIQTMENMAVVRSLTALAQPVRLQVFRRLVTAGPQGLTPGDLADELSVSYANLSFHLKELTNAGFVTQQRHGRCLIYRASFDRLKALVGYLTAHCSHDELGLQQLAQWSSPGETPPSLLGLQASEETSAMCSGVTQIAP